MENEQVQGLTSEEVIQSRERYGSNALTPPKREALWRKFAQKFRDPLIIILLVAMVLSLWVACYHYFVHHDALSVFLEPVGVLLSVVLATGVAFYFEVRSEREFEVLNQVSEDIVYKVYRDGELTQILKRDIVVGDMVVLDAGEEVPADGTLIAAVSLELDESSLTGEPTVRKTTVPEDFDPEATYPSNVICRGTNVLDGHCTYLVTDVGDATEHGRVFQGIQIDSSIETPLNKQLSRLAKHISLVSYVIALLVLVASVVTYASQGRFEHLLWDDAMEYFLGKIMIAVTVIVVAVPEGLPMSVTLSLAYSMRSMMKTNNLVRRMHACETMGATTVICTDKTGTLTQNRMTVVEAEFIPEFMSSPLLGISIALNSTAHLKLSNSHKPEVLGNPTEGALLLWLKDRGGDYQVLRDVVQLEDQLTFSTERKYMASVVRYEGRRVLLVKGAPEIVLGLCDMSGEEQERYEELLERYQKKAFRTIAFALKDLAEGVEPWQAGRLALGEMQFLGVVGISDPIRPDVPEAIAQCLRAGIEVKIVTGDTSLTAIEIGRQIGLWDETCTSEKNLITGADFAQMSDDTLRPRLQDIRIMCRARPMDKERLVRLLQEAGEVVAVTGDGTNDAPALSRAQVGLSMGDGTAVAKEASDITILDNSFSSITQAVVWGRSLYLNIQRFILFQMTINVAACLIVLLGAFLGTDSPLTVTQMLWVNLIMDTFAALALASLPPRGEVMREKPRHPLEHIVTPRMAKRIWWSGLSFVVLLFILVLYFYHYDVGHLSQFSWGDMLSSLSSFNVQSDGLSAYELTVIFCFFVFLQFWNMFNAKAYPSMKSTFTGLRACRSFLVIAGIILLGQVLITSLGRGMFRVIPLDVSTWLILLIVTSPVLLVGEFARLSSRMRSSKLGRQVIQG